MPSYPATHNCRSLTIDACIGPKLFTDALTGAWILPFGLPSMIPGDHRMLSLDFDNDILFEKNYLYQMHSPHRVYTVMTCPQFESLMIGWQKHAMLHNYSPVPKLCTANTLSHRVTMTKWKT